MHRSLLLLPAGCGMLLATTATAQPAGFPSLAAIVSEMQTTATSYPSICQLVDLTARYGTPATHLGNHIHAVKISDNVGIDEDEPKFLMVAAHHGNEYGTPIAALHALARFTQDYGVDPTITALVDEYELWIAPVWNVDGYPTSRHNARPGGTVDLNRNYPFLWSTPCNNGVKGPSPASEPETQTMIAFSEDRHFTKVVDYHTYGQETLYAYRSSCNLHQLASYFRDEAIALSQASGYGGTHREPSANGEHYQWQLGNFSNYAFLTETNTTHFPTRAAADAEAVLLFPGTIWMLQRPIPVQGRVTDALTGAPIQCDISYVENPFTHGERNRSEPRFGRYHAFLPVGTHTLRFSHPSYQTREVQVNVTTSGAVADVALSPPGLAFSYPGGLPARVAPGGGTVVRVDVAPLLTTPQPGTGTAHVQSENGDFVIPMTSIAPNSYEASLPAFVCGETVRLWFSAEDTGGTTWNDSPVQVPTAVTVTTIASDDFEAASGWVGGQPGDTATTGRWNRMDPEPTGAQPGDDHTPAPGVACWVTDGRAGTSIGTYDVDGGFTRLLSPAFDLSASPEAVVSYWRWYANNGNSARDDVFEVELSVDDGMNWTNVETVGPTGAEASGGWFEHSFRVADLLTPGAQTRVRFVAADIGTGSIVEAAVDDFAISVITCDGSVERSGAGCPDSTGTAVRLTYSGAVGLGRTFGLGAETGAALPFALLGGAGSFDPGIVIPGTGGCLLFVSPDFSVGPFPSGSQVGVSVPMDAALVGRSLRWQAAVADPALATQIKAATSNALETRFGS